MAGQELSYDDAAEWYVRTRGITAEQMNDTLNWMCINNRRNASVNPLAIERRTYESLAEEAGLSLDEYMNSCLLYTSPWGAAPLTRIPGLDGMKTGIPIPKEAGRCWLWAAA